MNGGTDCPATVIAENNGELGSCGGEKLWRSLFDFHRTLGLKALERARIALTVKKNSPTWAVNRIDFFAPLFVSHRQMELE